MNNFNNELLTVDDLCEVLMIGRNLAYQLLSTKKIKAFKINHTWRIPRCSITEYIQQQCR